MKTRHITILISFSPTGPPIIISGLSDQTVKPGSFVQFSCATLGNPVPNITWLFNSSPVLSSPLHQISNSTLRIFSVTAQDQGMYQCVLDNRIGSAQSAARLSIQMGKNVLFFLQHKKVSYCDILSSLILWNHDSKVILDSILECMYFSMYNGVSEGYIRLVFEGYESTPDSVEELERGLWDAYRLFGCSSSGGRVAGAGEVFGGQHQSHVSELCVYCHG